MVKWKRSDAARSPVDPASAVYGPLAFCFAAFAFSKRPVSARAPVAFTDVCSRRAHSLRHDRGGVHQLARGALRSLENDSLVRRRDRGRTRHSRDTHGPATLL